MRSLLIAYLVMSAFGMDVFAARLAQSGDSTKHWVGTWSAAPYLVEAANMPPSPGLTNNSLRQVVRVSIGGDTIRLKLTNVNNSTAVTLKAVNIAVSKGSSSIDAATLKPLTFNGSNSATMNAGASVMSDPIAFALAPSMQVAITIWYGGTSSNMTGHVGARTNSFLLSGDKSTSPDFSGAVTTPRWYSINTIEVLAPKTTAAVAVIGNSITDGYGLTPDITTPSRWTDVFSRALLANAPTSNVGVLNMGIGGTNVLGNGLTTGNMRFQRDVLEQSGLRWVIIFYGVNDIGGGASSANLIDGLKKMATAAKNKGSKVYGGTITPFNGHSYYSAAREAVRNSVNEWIRSGGGGAFDAVIDFDKAIRDPADISRMKSTLKNDWLHPNVEGYKALGQSVDLKLFVVEPTGIEARGSGRETENRKPSLEVRDGSIRVDFDGHAPDGARQGGR